MAGDPLQEEGSGGLHDDLTASSEDQKQHWLHKAKEKTGYSQNAFHRGQYANISTAANGSSRVVLQIHEGAGSGYVAETQTAYVQHRESRQKTVLDLLD